MKHKHNPSKHEETFESNDETPSSQHSFLSLPQEIRNLIFSYLPPKELVLNRLISKQIDREIMSKHGPRVEKFNHYLLFFGGVPQTPFPTLNDYFQQLEMLKDPFLNKQYNEIKLIQQWKGDNWQFIQPKTKETLFQINTQATTLAQVQYREQLLDDLHVQIVGYILENHLKNDSYLNLSDLNLSRLPSLLFTHKKWKANWEGCTRLNMRNNHLTNFPMEITLLFRLQTLNLNNNQLIHLPNEIEKLENLEVLNLSSNQLCELPDGITNLQKLKHLDLANNNLSTLPKGIHDIIFLNIKNNPLREKIKFLSF